MASDAKVVLIRNRGRLPLLATSVAVDHEAFSVDRSELAIGAGSADVVEVGYVPPGPYDGISKLLLSTNDPDDTDSEFVVRLISASGILINVGDPLSDEFGIFDPNGTAQVDELRGKVVILVYFALF